MMRCQVILTAMVLMVSACDDQGSSQPNSEGGNRKTGNVVLTSDPVRYTKGLELYQQNCAACHGRQGEGAVNWQKRDEQGQYRPPPLNGTGHTWHHPKQVLMDIIQNGTKRLGGNMPAWKETLPDAQIEDILYWLQSQWPKEIYQVWYQNNREVLRE